VHDADLIVVGAGLFGSFAARAARRAGLSVLVVDRGEFRRASPAAAGLYRPDWLKKLGDRAALGLDVLRRDCSPAEATLTDVDSGRAERFGFLPPSHVLVEPDLRGVVSAISPYGVVDVDRRRLAGRLGVYVAAGFWTPQLLPEVRLKGKAGTALTFAGEHPGAIWRWAPYRQTMGFRRDPGFTYFADGTAILADRYAASHVEATVGRARRLGLTLPPVVAHTGIRPYVDGGPLFRRARPRVWVGAGGEKSGTVLGAAFAELLMREIAA